MFDKLINNLIVNRVFSFEKDKMLMLNKIPFVMFPAKSMARFIQTVGEEFGEEYLYNLGYDAGLIVAKDFTNSLGWIGTSFIKKKDSIFKMFEVMGFGKNDIKVWDSKTGRVLYRVTNHPVIDHSIKMFGNKELICPFYRGIEAAHWEYELGIKGCKLIETQCRKDKKQFCEWSNNYFKTKK